MDVVDHSLEIGKRGGIRLDIVIGISALSPAVVHVDVLVAESNQCTAHEDIGCILDDGLVDFAAEMVPGVPAHWRHAPQAVIQRQAAAIEQA